ncbi:MAG: class I SAM-dependent methyltransferase [Dehalococcoidia bacterium]|nr:class I SAM-dependent methyltransferase [Dehalococcoidia bacterium]
MEPGRLSINALVTAYSRAYHSTHDSPKIFNDALAGRMLAEEERSLLEQALAGLIKVVNPNLASTGPDQATALACVIQNQNGPITLSRSRYAEDCLERAVKRRVRQYVILGAGLDTFAYRRRDLLKRIQVFEIDHPDAQDSKLRRLARLGSGFPPQLHFLPMDFAKQSLIDVLWRSSYNPQEPTYFSWLGGTYYLTREVVFTTLRAIARMAPLGGTVVFDYVDQDAFSAERSAGRMRVMQAIASEAGEPMQASFSPRDLPRELQMLGLCLQEDLGPAEIEQRYFRGRKDAYHAFEHVHFASASVMNRKPR